MDDLHRPIGLFFTIVGLILVVVSFASAARAPMTEANVNLYAGASMLVFGGTMLWLSRRTT